MPGADDTKDQKPATPPGEGNPPDDGKPPGEEPEGGEDDLGDFADPKKAMEEIKKLRKEAADRRTKAKEAETKFNALNAKLEKLSKLFGDEDEVDPETKLKTLQEEKEALEIEASIAHLSRVYQVPVEQDDYFRFLLSQRLGALKEGEELGEDELMEVIEKVKAVAAPGKPSGGTGLGGQKPQPGAGEAVTVDQFKKMSTLEKSALYQKNPALYDKLRQESMK